MKNYNITGILAELALVFAPIVSSPDDLYAKPAPGSTYRGVSTELGAAGGTWSSNIPVDARNTLRLPTETDWPYGNGEREFDANTPFMINYTGRWREDINTWEANCLRVMRIAGTFLRNSEGPHKFLLCEEHYKEFLKAVSGREWACEGSGGDWGCRDICYEGGMVLETYGCPAGKSYAISSQSIEPEGDVFRLVPHKCVEFGSYGLAF